MLLGRVRVWVCEYGGQRTTCRRRLFPSTMWVPGIELGLPDLAASSLYPLCHLIGPTLTFQPTWMFIIWCICIEKKKNQHLRFILDKATFTLSIEQ